MNSVKAEPQVRTEPQQGVRGTASVGPFAFVNADAVVEHGGRRYRVVLYGAYNAGIIGPEFNGIAILSEDDKNVVADSIAQQGSGYFGPNGKQVDEWRRLVNAESEEFRRAVNAAPRLRYPI